MLLNRLRLLDTNIGVYTDIVSRLEAVEPQAPVETTE
jgi:hypothetical protein